MSDNKAAIVLDGVGKKYRRFRSPQHRILDLLGVPLRSANYSEFWALQDISLTVPQGTRLGLIGRNGAGKSTLLRLISQQSQPSTGRITVNGQVQALMELGTGFYPDFTGLQNIRSALAFHNLTSREIAERTDEIIDFTELEAFIDRPVREYSAGMYARLAFAVATSIKPEILIIDEILGAGDAYFTGKSIRRMKNLAESGATILFVSHDTSAVQMLCDQAIWIHKGRMVMHDDTLTVSKAYLAHVREEEEVRQRARTLQLTERQAAALSDKQALFRLRGANGSPPAKPVAIGQITIGQGDAVLDHIDPGTGEAERSGGLMVDKGKMNWGDTAVLEGKLGRQFGNFGGAYGHAPFTFSVPPGQAAGRWIEISHGPVAADLVSIELHEPGSGSYTALGTLGANERGWARTRLELPQHLLADTEEEASASAVLQELVSLDKTERYGSGEARVTSFAFMVDGKRCHTLITGEPASAVFTWKSDKPINDASAVIAIYQGDGTCAMQVVSQRDGFELGTLDGEGVLKVDFTPLLLGPGEYIVSVALFKALSITSAHEAEAYDLHDRCYTLKVLPPPGINIGIGTVNQAGKWSAHRSSSIT